MMKKKETARSRRSGSHYDQYSVSTLETEELYRLIQEAVFSLPDKCRNIFCLAEGRTLRIRK